MEFEKNSDSSVMNRGGGDTVKEGIDGAIVPTDSGPSQQQVQTAANNKPYANDNENDEGNLDTASFAAILNANGTATSSISISSTNEEDNDANDDILQKQIENDNQASKEIINGTSTNDNILASKEIEVSNQIVHNDMVLSEMEEGKMDTEIDMNINKNEVSFMELDSSVNKELLQSGTSNFQSHPTVNASNIMGGSSENLIVVDDEDDDDYNNELLDDDDEEEDDDDYEMDNENTVTYISVYTGEAIEKPSPVKKKKKSNLTSTTSTTTNAITTSLSSPLISSSSPEEGFYALRKGQSSSHCIYLRRSELYQQIKGCREVEYEFFTDVKDAIEYIQNDPLYIIRANSKKRKVYEIDNDNEGKKNDDTTSFAPTPPTKKTKLSNDDEEESWEGMYVQLLHFQREHGCTDIPTLFKYKTLHTWAKEQRKEFYNFANGIDSTMTEAKVQLLLGINFDFGIKTANRTFYSYCQELVNYRARNDQQDPKRGTNLNSWIARIKRKYETFIKEINGDNNVDSAQGDKGKSTVLGMDKVKAHTLELIGFSWTKEPSEECKKVGRKFFPVQYVKPAPMTDGGTSAAAVLASSSRASAMAYASTNAAENIEAARASMLNTTEQAIQKQDELLPYSNAQHLLPILPKGSEKAVEEKLKQEQQMKYQQQMEEQLQLQQKQIHLQKAQMQQLQTQLAQQNVNFTRPVMPIYHLHPPTQSYPIVVQSPRQTNNQPSVPANNNINNYQPIAPKAMPSATTVYRNNDKWSQVFADLKQFKVNNGHLNVENKDSNLAKWCLTQRRSYKRYKKGAKTILTEEKISKLKDLGFDFEPLCFMNKNAQNFHKRCEELKKFKEEHGHCEVPTKSSLYAYLVDQKAICRKYEEGKGKEGFKYNEWTETKVAKLKEIGFDFVNRRKSDKRISSNRKHKPMTEKEKVEAQEEWMKMFEEIKAFKKQHGHCIPPSKPWTPLRSWMEKQRNGYKSFLAGRETEMTGLRIRYLNEIQFPFTPTRVKVPWEERFLELKLFKEKYGNCLVPRGYQGKLGNWLQNQRNSYKALKAGKKSSMTQEQIKKLEDLGMVWSILPTPVVGERKSWEERFQDLLQYQEEHGHMRVPQSYPGLGNWVHTQRVGYQQMKKGQQTTRLSTEKALRLAEVGFEFVVAPNKQRPSRQNLYNPIPHLTRRAAEETANDDDEEESSEEEENDDEQEEERGVASQPQTNSYLSWYTGGANYM